MTSVTGVLFPEWEPSRGPGAPCEWCGNPIPAAGPEGRATRGDAETCGKVCRQARHRFLCGVVGRPGARDASTAARADDVQPIRVAYADPPYPGFAHLYEDHPDYGGEVDHAALVERLCDEYPDGWALSTSSKTLQQVLALCPPDVRIGAWTKPTPPSETYFPRVGWEPIIARGGRAVLRRSCVDWVHAAPTRAVPGQIVGTKPPAFAAKVFDHLGLIPGVGDQLDDLFPGSGAIGRAWAMFDDYAHAS